MLNRFVRLTLASFLFAMALQIGLNDVMDEATMASVLEFKEATLSYVNH